MTSEVKINSINMFINKFDTVDDIIDIDKFKTEFRLDEGESGFYKLSLSQKKKFGKDSVNDTYNRPPIGPIVKGLYCSFCSRIGPQDHTETCDFPEDNSLYLTFSKFDELILRNRDYKGDYIVLKDKINNETVTQLELNEILLNPDEITVTNGRINREDVLTNVSYFGMYKKRGPNKLASKTATTQFLNNLIIFYQDSETKTSIRISKNGLINLISVPRDRTKLDNLINSLIERINETTAIDTANLKEVTGSDKYTYIQDKSYIHSMSAQFTIDTLANPGNQIDFESLDRLISPFDSIGNLVGSKLTQIETTQSGKKIIIFKDNKIIEWEYSLGRLTRNQVMSKEYIKFITNPAPGLKLTSIINKFGTIMMSQSMCSEKLVNQGLCTRGKTAINQNYFDAIKIAFNSLFQEYADILVKKSLETSIKTSNAFNTVSGYAPSGKICRLSRTRDGGDGNYKEGMRPVPYSWKGRCPDPNYQYINPEGVKSDDLWYPCCETKNKESIEMMKKYLLTGFPRNSSQAAQYNITQNEDLGSGILIPDSNIVGATANVKINGVFQSVIVVKKGLKKLNEYVVKTPDGKKVTVSGRDFERDSRVFPGLNSFSRDQLINCIQKNLFKFNLIVDDNGNLIINNISNMNELYDEANANKFTSLIDISKIVKRDLTYYSLELIVQGSYNLRRVPGDTYNFFLVLSPNGNFYINDEFKTVECQVSNKFTDTIIMNGYLKFNIEEAKNEYHITDLIFYNESLYRQPFQKRYEILYDIQNLLFADIIDEILVYPDIYSNLIEGSYQIIQNNSTDKLIFNNSSCCDSIIWGNIDTFSDNLKLQVIGKNKQEIKFGHSGRQFPPDLGLDFLNPYTLFGKREIPTELIINNYVNIKINRDSSGKVVPNRKISILNIDPNQDTRNYTDAIDILLIKFNPIDYTFFSDYNSWEVNGVTLTYVNEVLSRT